MKLQWSFTQRLNSFRIQNQTGNLFLELIHWSEIKLKHSGHAFQVFPPTGVCFLLPELSSIQRYIPVSSYRRLLYGSDDADKSLRSGTSEGYDSLQFVQRVLSWHCPDLVQITSHQDDDQVALFVLPEYVQMQWVSIKVFVRTLSHQLVAHLFYLSNFVHHVKADI